MSRALRAYIDCTALQYNLNQVKKCAPRSKILAMIKANGYGHGIVAVAKTLSTADAFGVACLEEALQLREAGIQNRIVLMEGFFTQEELPILEQWNLEPIIHQTEQIAMLKEYFSGSATSTASTSQKPPLAIWIKINTGMNRLGFPYQDFQEIYRTLLDLPFLKIQAVLSHFSNSDDLTSGETSKQLQRFQAATQGCNLEKSLANSAGILAWPESHFDWVRPGIMLYGASPFPNRCGQEEGLKPVMALRSEIIAIQHLKKGDSLGYGNVFKAPDDTAVGVVALGYADGYPRLAPAGTPVLVKGKPSTLIGRVSMDMLTVDLRGHPEVKVGDPVELWGPNLASERVAASIGTVSYELLTSLSIRVPLSFN